MTKSIGRHLALAWFPIADLDKEKPQQISLSGCALAYLCLDQRSECIEILLGDKTCARINLQAREMIYLGQAELQNAKIALHILLLIARQLQPTTLNRGNGIARYIEAGGKDITRFLVGSLQEGCDGAR